MDLVRSITTYEAYGSPVLAAFWDGSDHAFAVVIYAILQEKDTLVEVSLEAS